MVRVGIGFDAHRLADGRELILGGEKIDHPKGLAGHSDGDVLFHAVTDAVLGAVAAPDIGALFPPSDPRWKGADSEIFLREAARVAQQRGFRVQQVDAVVIAEAPRLAVYIPSIRARMAELLGIAVDAVGLKATTTDGMGYAGRGEGIAAQAVVTVSDD